MPTTCGFPNCKFRSRYRGQEDNRHFYRIPKRPQVLRQRWLLAIGRTEETVVSQLRICSAHFEGGEKKEGDIPVPDPTVDKQLNIELPPKESKGGERKRNKGIDYQRNFY
ncbi:THAP domain protein [Necator americanus]|uniref:THAP domain protein n=1 Tax=Necator americanus TaxID=51031 RepID=W2TN15_NECAM|nr:THAP domain protein [Necator americanus]ETN83495.1 THAP domain protein [Necator americanus]